MSEEGGAFQCSVFASFLLLQAASSMRRPQLQGMLLEHPGQRCVGALRCVVRCPGAMRAVLRLDCAVVCEDGSLPGRLRVLVARGPAVPRGWRSAACRANLCGGGVFLAAGSVSVRLSSEGVQHARREREKGTALSR